jgi:outer membrane protein OmpA-like peptidoglycan-associated protein
MMMNSKYLVFILFAVWCAICWRWYVCGIKDACITRPLQTVQLTPEPPAIEPDTQTNEEIIRPVKEVPAIQKNRAAPKKEQTNFKPNAIDKVQLESVEDYMVVHFPYKSVRKEDNVAINAYLTKLAEQLTTSKQKVSITGHTDFVGDAQSNVQFGQQRAESIRDILIKKGVKKNQIKCVSMGDKKPVATNDTPQGRYKNRRVVIKVQN